MERFVLDANLFFNMEAGFDLGQKTNEVITKITHYGAVLKNKAEFLMPPGAVTEFLSFFKDKNQPVIKKLLSVIVICSPNKNKLQFPAAIFYQLVEETKKRSARGLTIGEEAINKTGLLMAESSRLTKKQFEIKIGPVIKNFRERYRQATRLGFLDSITDLDLIVLAKEKDGFLVSADEGVIFWGRCFGVKEMLPSVFRQRLDFLIDHQE